MLQDSEKFKQCAKMALDSEQQYKELEKQASKELASTEFCHMTTPDFDKGERVIRAQNQAPLDMVAELKAINERLDVEQKARILAESKAAEVERHHKENLPRSCQGQILTEKPLLFQAIISTSFSICTRAHAGGPGHALSWV